VGEQPIAQGVSGAKQGGAGAGAEAMGHAWQRAD
jgi:hypothetical protein